MSADKMPPLPEPWVTDSEECGTGHDGESLYQDIPLFTADQMHAYARAYAAEQTRELVEALELCVEDSGDAVSYQVATYGENWKPDRLAALRSQIATARALIAKHKEQA